MTMTTDYAAIEPARSEVDQFDGPTLIEFGAPWCGHCMAAQPLLASVMSEHTAVRHLKIEDGKGRPLGRSFRVTLWPTLIFMNKGKEIARLVRPTESTDIKRALIEIDAID